MARHIQTMSPVVVPVGRTSMMSSEVHVAGAVAGFAPSAKISALV